MSESVEERAEKYGLLTEQAFEKVSIKPGLSEKELKIVQDFLSMARNYLSDGKHFQEKKEGSLALAAFSYAHAWLDAGVRAGFLDGKEDDRLFTLP